MCLCDPSAVHIPADASNELIKPGTGSEYARSFAEEFFGEEKIDSVRSHVFAAEAEVAENPFRVMCDCGDAFIDSAISDPWHLLVIVLAFGAGTIIRWKHKAAMWLLGAGVLISMMALAAGASRQMHRVSDLAMAERYSLLIYDYLPAQVFANVLVQIVTPFLLAIAIAWIVGLPSRAIANLRGNHERNPA